MVKTLEAFVLDLTPTPEDLLRYWWWWSYFTGIYSTPSVAAWASAVMVVDPLLEVGGVGTEKIMRNVLHPRLRRIK